MKSRTMKFSLDCAKVGNQVCIDGIRQGDSNSLVFIISLKNGINLLDIVSGEEESVVITMYGKKSDGTTIVRDCGINEDGNIIYTIHTQDTSCVGLVSYQLVITSTRDKILASPVFSTMVEERNLLKTYTVLTAEPDDWTDNYDRYYYYVDGRFYKLNKYERETTPEFVINTYYTVNNDEVESTSDFDALSYALLRAKQYSDKAEQYLEEVQKKADKATTLDGYGITDALKNSDSTVNTSNLADNSVTSNKLSADIKANIDSKASAVKVSQQLATKADINSVYSKSETDTLLNDKANTADVDTAVENINTTIANNQKAVNTSLDNLSTALNNKVDTDVVEEIKKSVESNTTAIESKENTSFKVSSSIDVKDATKNYPSIDYINNYCVNNTYASKTFEKASNKKSSISESIADKNFAYPSIKYLEDYIKNYATNYYKQSEIDTLLLAKYNSSNVEYGTATLTPHSTQTDKVKTASCEYKKIGNTVIANVHLVMNECTVGGNVTLHLLNMPFKGARITRCLGVSSANNYVCKGQITTSAWFQLANISKTTMSFSADEEVDFTVNYKILDA